MKLKINKACDLNSISVLPPPARRLSGVPHAQQPMQQLRPQASQQSFSQAISSQQGLFTQMSQSSYGEAFTNDQRQESQERENSVKRYRSLPPVAYGREESQMLVSRSSASLRQKWNPAPIADRRINEELEYKIDKIESSMNKLGMILDSIQSDMVQINKGTKEVSVELEGIRQKLTANSNSLQLLHNVQENVKDSIDGNFKLIESKLSTNSNDDKLHHNLLILSALPNQIEASMHKLQSELNNAFKREILTFLATTSSHDAKHPTPKCDVPSALSRRDTGRCLPPCPPQKAPGPPRKPTEKFNSMGLSTPMESVRQASAPKIQMGKWNSVKTEHVTSTGQTVNDHKRRTFQKLTQDKDWHVIIESDEEIDGGFSCLMDGKDAGGENHEANETENILRRARRRRRRSCIPIVISS